MFATLNNNSTKMYDSVDINNYTSNINLSNGNWSPTNEQQEEDLWSLSSLQSHKSNSIPLHTIDNNSLYHSSSNNNNNLYDSNVNAIKNRNYNNQSNSVYYPLEAKTCHAPRLAQSNNESKKSSETLTNLPLNTVDTNNQQTSSNVSHLNYPAYFTTQKLTNSATKLSYTPYQLELLNSIYMDMKYPNSVQKTLIAKCIGITRDQVKIWFQNRRRKDTINSQGSKIKTSSSLKRTKSDENDENDDYDEQQTCESIHLRKSLVGSQIIEGVLNELRNHKNAPSRLSSKRAKLGSADEENLLKPMSENLLSNATQILDSQVLKKTPNNCIIDLCPIINGNKSSSSSSSTTTTVDQTPSTTSNVINSTSNTTATTDNQILNKNIVTTTTTTSNGSQQPVEYYNNSTPSSNASILSNSFTCTSSSSSEELESTPNYINIASNYDQRFQIVQKPPYELQNYLYKKYYPNYYYKQSLPQQTYQPLPQQQQQSLMQNHQLSAWSQIDTYNSIQPVNTTTSTGLDANSLYYGTNASINCQSSNEYFQPNYYQSSSSSLLTTPYSANNKYHQAYQNDNNSYINTLYQY